MKRGSSRIRRGSSRRNKENGSTKSKSGDGHRMGSLKNKTLSDDSHPVLTKSKSGDSQRGASSRLGGQKGRSQSDESHPVLTRSKALDNSPTTETRDFVKTPPDETSPHATLVTQHHNPRSIQITITYKPRI